MSYRTNWNAVVEQLPQLLKGLVFTIQISVTAYACALVVGLVVALCRLSPWTPLRLLAFGYTQFFRAISIYIYIIWIYFGLSAATGINLSPFAASVVAITLLHSAYMSEIYRAALQSVQEGQREAASSLGMSRVTTFFDVVLPQALAVAVPPLIVQSTMILKDSSVVALIGASDLMHETIRAANLEFRSFEFYSTAAAIYLSLVIGITALGRIVERNLRVGFQ